MDENSVSENLAPPPLPRSQRVLCKKCGRFLEADNAFCPHCGARQSNDDAWYYNPFLILIMAFVALGPFAIPLVWKSKKMTVTVKTAMTVIILAYTALCCYLFYVVLAFEFRHLGEIDRMMRMLKR